MKRTKGEPRGGRRAVERRKRDRGGDRVPDEATLADYAHVSEDEIRRVLVAALDVRDAASAYAVLLAHPDRGMRVVAYQNFRDEVLAMRRRIAATADSDAGQRALFFGLVEEAALARTEAVVSGVHAEPWAMRRASLREAPERCIRERIAVELPQLAAKLSDGAIRRAVDAAANAGRPGNNKGQVYSDVWHEMTGTRVAPASLLVGLAKLTRAGKRTD